MDYAEQVKNVHIGERFTFYDYRRLKRKPPKVETKPETEQKDAHRLTSQISLGRAKFNIPPACAWSRHLGNSHAWELFSFRPRARGADTW